MVSGTNHSSYQETRLNHLSYSIKIWTDLSSVLSQCTRLTDGRTDRRTDRILIARPRLHSMQRGKNFTFSGVDNAPNFSKIPQSAVELLMIFNMFSPVFTMLHTMQTRSSDDNSVRPSVCCRKTALQGGKNISGRFELCIKHCWY